MLTKKLRCDNIHIVARLVGQGVKTSPSHGENTSSILVLAAEKAIGVSGCFFIVYAKNLPENLCVRRAFQRQEFSLDKQSTIVKTNSPCFSTELKQGLLNTLKLSGKSRFYSSISSAGSAGMNTREPSFLSFLW